MPAATPPPPRTLDEVFAVAGGRFKILMTIPQTEIDVAGAVKELDGGLNFETLCFETGPDKYDTYMCTGGGIWEEHRGRGAILERVQNVRRRIYDAVIQPLIDLVSTLKSKADNEAMLLLKRAETVLVHLTWIHTKLGSTAFCRAVSSCIQQRIASHVRAMGITQDIFDTRPNCIGFQDGVYDFEQRSFVRGPQAREYMLTKAVPYSYEDVVECSEKNMAEFSDFLRKIHPDEGNRNYLLVRLRNAARKKNDQIILIHYNIRGSNGKSTLFSLLRKTFGPLMVTCNPSLLVAATLNNPNAANEELYSIKGTSLVMLTEPSATTKLSAAFIKRLTGDDEQSARKNYGSKSTFVFSGLTNVICNKIPQVDDMDGGMERRLRCLPYKSIFVCSPLSAARDYPLGNNVFVRDDTVSSKFDDWRCCFMRLILDAPDECPDPPDVMEHTKRLVARESIIQGFVESRLCRTDQTRDVLKLKDAWAAWKEHAHDRSVPVGQYATFSEEIESILGSMVHKSGNLRSSWRGWRLVQDDHDDDVDPSHLA